MSSVMWTPSRTPAGISCQGKYKWVKYTIVYKQHISDWIWKSWLPCYNSKTHFSPSHDVICGGENGTDGCQLVVFSVDIAFAHCFVAPTLHPYRSACGIGHTSKKLFKMVGNSATYPFNSWCIDRLWMNAIESWWIAWNSIFLPEIQYFK